MAENTAQPTSAAEEYLPTLLQYYEEEIAGEAFFYELAERMLDPTQKAKMVLLAEVERHTANIVFPLLERYALTPKSDGVLFAEGRADADDVPQDWHPLIAYMAKKFPDYMPAFERLEAMAPEGDLPQLKRMTEHEVVAIEFLNRELANDPSATDPLLAFRAKPAV